MLRVCLATYEAARYERVHQQMIAEGLLAALPTRPFPRRSRIFHPEEIPGPPCRRRFGRSGGNARLCGHERLVKRYVAEVGSAWVRRLLAHPAQYVIYTAALSQVEVISALRRGAGRSLEVTQAERLAHRVTIHFAQRYQVIALTQAIVDQACVGLQAHPLRAADAIHLACALTIRRITQEQGLPPPSFVVADTALRAAATAEGFVVDNPLQHP